MTDNNNKARALILAALMVFSVFAGTVALSGSVMAQAGNEASDLEHDEDLDSGTTYWQGQVLILDANEANWDNETFELRAVEDGNLGSLEDQVVLDENGTATIDTSDLDGTYVIEDSDGDVVTFGTGDASSHNTANEGNIRDASFEVTTQDFSADFADDSVQNDQTTDVEFASNRGEYSVNVSADGDLDNSELDDIFGSEVDGVVNADGENGEITLEDVNDGAYEANFTGIDTSEYDFDFDVTDTSATDSDSINVTEADEAQAMFTQNTYSVAQGGIAEITVELESATEGTLVVGDEGDDGYQANVTFTDEDEDGEVTVLFNTYAAGNNSAGIVSAAGDDDTANLITDGTDLGDSLLGQGGYNLAVDTGHAENGNEVTTSGNADFGSLSIGERSTDSMTLWTAPSGAVSDELLDSATEDGTTATGDWAVHQVEATGLEGLVDGDLSEAFGEGVNLSVTQTGETTLQNRDPKSLNVTEALEDGDIELIADAENESYYIALDTSTDAFERPDASSNNDNLSAAAGEDYTATFTVDDAKLVGEDDEDHESVNATFEVVAGTATLDTTPVNVTASEDAEITGTSTLAPGSEIRNIVVESTGDTSPRFYNSPTAVVQDDGTWNITVDLTEQAADDTFSVSAGDYFDADGNVVESVGTETATATPSNGTDTATATPSEGTDTAAPGGTETPEPDDGGTTTTTTPGFGVAVALVALLAAALLAGRRE